ncbi:MAG: POTRA domain-containing protein [Hyphomicrobiales bacterium]
MNNTKLYFTCIAFIFLFWNRYAIAQEDSKTTDKLFIDRIDIKGNKKTKSFIIYRELEFDAQSWIAPKALDSLIYLSTNNLKRTPLFNFINIKKTISNDTVSVLVDVVERWYIWPLPVFRIADRNINEWIRRADISRVDYGVHFFWYNFRGRNEVLKLLVQAGYENQFELGYSIPYINKRKNLGLDLSIGYRDYKEVAYNVNGDTLTYYINRTMNPEIQFFSNIGLSYRPDYNNVHSFGLSYRRSTFSDTLLLLNPSFTYKSKGDPEFLTLRYKYTSDFRDQKSYPLNGYHFSLELSKLGLGLLNQQYDSWLARSEFDWYKKVAKDIYYAVDVTSLFSFGKELPFNLQPGIGFYGDVVRGYDHYVTKGKNYGLIKNNFKYTIIPTKVKNINFIKTEKFSKVHYALYLNLFFDVAYVDTYSHNPINRLEDTLIYGYGIGLDFVTYYDMVWRLEYSFNKFGESGFFINFSAPI